MSKQYSIAEARNHFAAIIHDLETTPSIQVTRRGKPVAVLLSVEEYERLTKSGPGFWESYQSFRQAAHLDKLDIEPEVFAGVRDSSPGRDVAW